MTGRVTPKAAQILRDNGLDVRVVQPNDGAGTIVGPVSWVGKVVSDWARAGWQADIFIEYHGQALGNLAVRGQFVIYPDWPDQNDVDAEVRDDFGPLLAMAVEANTGIPMYGSGLLSERKTQVGLDGFRLGIFSTTKALAPKTLRMIAEVATYTSALDRAIIARADFPEKIGLATLEAIKVWQIST